MCGACGDLGIVGIYIGEGEFDFYPCERCGGRKDECPQGGFHAWTGDDSGEWCMKCGKLAEPEPDEQAGKAGTRG